MKRVGHIFERVCDLENLRTAILNSSRGKRNQKRVARILANSDAYASSLREMLLTHRYEPSPYVIKTIYDGASRKARTIHKPRYWPDQVIHWALMQQLQASIMKGMYAYNCGSVPGRGTSYGQKTLRRWLDRDYKGTKYCLKLDIAQFYPSVDNRILKAMFRRRIKDPHCLWLIDAIVDSAAGLPIGNYTSQWFANFFLQGLDHYIKERLGVRYYVRYVDDLVLLGPNKKKLHAIRKGIADYLAQIDLRLKDNWQLFRVSDRAIDFLGFRFFRAKTILRKRNALRIRRRLRKIAAKGNLGYRDACAVLSYWGWIKHSDSYRFYHKHIKPLVCVNQARKVVSAHGRLRANRSRQTTPGASGDSQSQAGPTC